ncbi:MAG: glycosyltransferase family 2 protein [Firmicutes bacterium]|nr:glycosyltransferase family 2 protein [Bacillota bacterium]
MKNKECTRGKTRVLAIVPAYNEEKTVGEVVRELKLQGVDVLVVNDGSQDRTGEAAAAAGAEVVNLPFNLGIGGAVQTGYRYAATYNYDIAVQVDGDGQHDPACLDQLLRPLLAGEADLVLGSRFLGSAGYRVPLLRRLGMLVFTSIISLLYKRLITDTTSGYRAANKELIHLFAQEYPTDYPEVEVLAQLCFLKKRLKEVPVRMLERAHGSSSITLGRSLYYMLKVSLAIFKNIKWGTEKNAF